MRTQLAWLLKDHEGNEVDVVFYRADMPYEEVAELHPELEVTLDGKECQECGDPATVYRTDWEITRSVYRYGIEFEEDVPVEAFLCHECNEEVEDA